MHAGYPSFPPFPEGQKSSPCDAIDQEGFQPCRAVRICETETALDGPGPAEGKLVFGLG